MSAAGWIGVALAGLAAAGPAGGHAFFAGQSCPVETIAHRGGAALAPENTLVAFERAAALGAQVLEMDLRVSADGAIVVIHDATVDRTTDGAGPVAALGLAELRALDAGYRFTPDGGQSFPYRGRGVRVPTLEEVAARLPRARLNLEMKQFTVDQAEALCALVLRAGLLERVLVASAVETPLGAFRRACPRAATSMSAGEAYVFIQVTSAFPPPAAALQIPERIGERVLATPQLVAAARARGLRVHVWTVNDEARMRALIALGVDGIITDRPDRLLALTACRNSGSGS
ncbi:MAG TPA: glycerophosphodiester phosphodiesterase [Burkholderiales bacterium]|nr:glycerophosphodiester phosphodiesterase [Burkholderiales bacterium]